jgi:hypothetical protein
VSIWISVDSIIEIKYFFRQKKDELPLLIVDDNREGLHAISSEQNLNWIRKKMNANLRWKIDGNTLYKSRWKVRSDL